jgi:hypothetical protein
MMETIEGLIAEYTKSAIEHGLGTENGNSKRTNRAYDKIHRCYQSLKNFGDLGSQAITNLMEHENDSVKCWSAYHSLLYHRQKAVETLEDLAKKDGIIAFNAEMTLELWKKGTLKII